ncbi:hypothetical protein RHMOL_Rhmol03G0045200 [Rhododendron molle]|uniref:Uncharacterized protein n=1 Tax=Rhododendron molle TaxID=49168 RepID=A0ACC0PBZ2_RHOML|nr:hypothetical protein RHMOL_Rhmol03G0045200 [Rhododendron molle]
MHSTIRNGGYIIKRLVDGYKEVAIMVVVKSSDGVEFKFQKNVTAAEPLADDQAKETYAKILGTVFSPVSFQTDHLISSPSPEQGSEQRGRIEESDQRNSWSTALREIFSDSLKRLFHQVDVKSLPEVDLHGVSWHQHKHILAFISGPNHVTIRDYEDSEGKEPFILTHESQRDVKLLEWRPNGGRTLSVACNLSISSHEIPESPLPETAREFSLHLASDGTFYLWETNTWTSEPWSSTSGFVTGATWDPDGRMILIAFSDSSTLGSIHFASNPPSLDAHLLPVDLPEVKSLTHSRGIEKIAWDGSGERLAISYKDGDDLYKGLIAVYDVRRSKLISASLISTDTFKILISPHVIDPEGSLEGLETIQGQSHSRFMTSSNKDHCSLCVGAADYAAPTLLYFGRMFSPNPGSQLVIKVQFGRFYLVGLLEWVKEYPMVGVALLSNRGFLCSHSRGDIVCSNLLEVLDICVVTFSVFHIQYLYLCISRKLKFAFFEMVVIAVTSRF